MGIWSRIKGAFTSAPPPAPPPPATPEPVVEEAEDIEEEDELEYQQPIARDRDLEAAIATDPDAHAPYLVYADWLQEHGDPRGELIALQHALHTTTDITEHERLTERVDEFLEQHGESLAGPADQYGIDVEYHLGFVRTMALGDDVDQLEQILTADHPALLLLREISVSSDHIDEATAIVAKVGRGDVIVLDEDERRFGPDGVQKVTAAIEIEDGEIDIVVDSAPFSGGIGYSYMARTTFGDDAWWHGSGDALTEESMCDDPMRSGAAQLAIDRSRELRIELRARIATEDETHTLWFQGTREVSESGAMLLQRCEPRTGAPFDVPAPAVASPRVGPVLLTEDPGAFSRERFAALPGIGVYADGMLHAGGGGNGVPSHAPPGDCFFKGAYGGADRALVLIHEKRGKDFGTWLTTTRAGEKRAQVDPNGSVYGGAVDPKGRWFAALLFTEKTSRLVVFDIDNGERLHAIDVPASELHSYGVAWHGDTAVAIGDGAIGCVDVATGAKTEMAVPKMIGFGWRQYGAGVPTYHLGLQRSAWMMCAEFPEPSLGDETGTTLIGWRDRGGPYRMVAVPDHGWGTNSQFGTVAILDDGRIVGIGTRIWVVDPETRIASDYGAAGLHAATPVIATVDGHVRLYNHGAGPWWTEL